MFGRATIRLGIGPHSSSTSFKQSLSIQELWGNRQLCTPSSCWCMSSFFTFQAFSWTDIVPVTNKVNASAVVWHRTQKLLLQVVVLQLTEVFAAKLLMALNECHGIYNQNDCLIRWWQFVFFWPGVYKQRLDSNQIVWLVAFSYT